MSDDGQTYTGNPDDPFAAIARETIADQLQAQRDVLELENYGLRRWLYNAPGSQVVRLGAGGRVEETLPGDERDPWIGVAILNPSSVPIGVGFAAGGAIGTPLFTIPAGSYLTVPVRFVNVSVALVNASDALGPEARIVVCRLRVPPLGIQAGSLAGAVDLGGVADTNVASASTAAAPVAGTTIAAIAGLTPGVYRVDVVTYQHTAPDANLSNARLLASGLFRGPLPTTSQPIATALPRVTVSPGGTSTLELQVTGNAGAGAIYYGSLTATRLA